MTDAYLGNPLALFLFCFAQVAALRGELAELKAEREEYMSARELEMAALGDAPDYRPITNSASKDTEL